MGYLSVLDLSRHQVEPEAVKKRHDSPGATSPTVQAACNATEVTECRNDFGGMHSWCRLSWCKFCKM
jgi:hypothetical protein